MPSGQWPSAALGSTGLRAAGGEKCGCGGGEAELLHLAWQAHTDVVSTLAFSPDELTLASGSWDGTVKLWDLRAGPCSGRGRHTNTISCLAFSPDGRLLASGGRDATVRLWDAHSGTNLQDPATPWFGVSGSPGAPMEACLPVATLRASIRLWQVQKTAPARLCADN